MDFDEIDYLEKTVENPEVDETVKPKDNGHSRSSKHKSDERRGHDLDHRSKHVKYGDDGYDHVRQRERSMSRHHRSSSKDRERGGSDKHWSNREHSVRDRDNGSEERNGRGREREREQGRGRRHDRKEQHCETERESEKERKERDHEGHRERNKERERERERENEHSRRSKSHSERYSSRNDRDREKELKEKENERELKERESRRYKEKKDDVAEPEADPERDQRTVFAYQISLKADERDVYEFFSRAGKVRDVRLIMDRNSRRSKGVGYIEFYDVMSVPMAIALSGQPLLSQPVMVKPSEAEKNLAQSTTAAAGGPAGVVGPYSGGARRLYVGNLHFNITEDQLRQVFEPFGTVELVQLPLDLETGQCKGFGFIQFARLEDARAAQSLNGQLDIAGRVIKVSAITDQAGMQDVGANAADFDDDEGGGLSLNARSRAVLMQKLDRTGAASSIAGPLVNSVSSAASPLPPAPLLGATPMVSPLVAPLVQASLPALGGLPGAGLSIPATVPTFDTVGVPSECLLLKNMFDPSLETEPDFDLDIKEDVEDECKRFGKLKHIHVDKNSAGFVYLRFENTQSAMNAQRSLHGRWFAGKMITATCMLPQNYEAKFPEN